MLVSAGIMCVQAGLCWLVLVQACLCWLVLV